jgi:hypothetical protein
MVLTVMVLLYASLLAMAAGVALHDYPLTRLVLNAGKTIEVRRSEAADAKGKSDSAAQLQRLFYSSTQDRSRAQIGLPPMPKPVPPPPPPTEERTKEILADDRVQVQQTQPAGHVCIAFADCAPWRSMRCWKLCYKACLATQRADVGLLARGHTGAM